VPGVKDEAPVVEMGDTTAVVKFVTVVTLARHVPHFCADQALDVECEVKC
jgi:hypothetical protein